MRTVGNGSSSAGGAVPSGPGRAGADRGAAGVPPEAAGPGGAGGSGAASMTAVGADRASHGARGVGQLQLRPQDMADVVARHAIGVAGRAGDLLALLAGGQAPLPGPHHFRLRVRGPRRARRERRLGLRSSRDLRRLGDDRRGVGRRRPGREQECSEDCDGRHRGEANRCTECLPAPHPGASLRPPDERVNRDLSHRPGTFRTPVSSSRSRRRPPRSRAPCSRSARSGARSPGTNSLTGPCATSRAMNRCQETPPPRSPSSQKLRCLAPSTSRGPIVLAFGGTHDQSLPNECSAFCMTVIGCSSTSRAPARFHASRSPSNSAPSCGSQNAMWPLQPMPP